MLLIRIKISLEIIWKKIAKVNKLRLLFLSIASFRWDPATNSETKNPELSQFLFFPQNLLFKKIGKIGFVLKITLARSKHNKHVCENSRFRDQDHEL